MYSKAFETVTRRTVDGISRRASLATLGGAALAATVAQPDVGEAKKGGESCGKKQKKKCTNNKADCNALGPAVCPTADPQCLTTVALCCNECFSAPFLTCLLAAIVT